MNVKEEVKVVTNFAIHLQMVKRIENDDTIHVFCGPPNRISSLCVHTPTVKYLQVLCATTQATLLRGVCTA